jgi:DNA-binding MarR family transcriptional regulator
MSRPGFETVVHELLASAHIFAAAAESVLERSVLREVAGETITYTQFRLLRMLAHTDARTIKDIAIFLGVSNAAVSKAVDRLVRRGMAVRRESTVDRREVSVELTDDSRKLLERYDELRDRVMIERFLAVPEDDIRRSTRLLDRLSSALLKESGEAAEETCTNCGIYFRDRCRVRRSANRDCFYVGRESERHSPPALAAVEGD